VAKSNPEPLCECRELTLCLTVRGSIAFDLNAVKHTR